MIARNEQAFAGLRVPGIPLKSRIALRSYAWEISNTNRARMHLIQQSLSSFEARTQSARSAAFSCADLRAMSVRSVAIN